VGCQFIGSTEALFSERHVQKVQSNASDERVKNALSVNTKFSDVSVFVMDF
jgi:hypothetical protein